MTKRHSARASALRERYILLFLAFVLLIGMAALGYSLFTVFFDRPSEAPPFDVPRRLGMTSFDRTLALQLMDKDGDGKCDACGMPVGMCIDGGQIECTMVEKDGIGILNSDHLHADWKIYINNQPLDLSDMAHMERMRQNKPVSSFIHVDSGAPPPEKIGDVLHMHATDVPLWIFFESVGMKLTSDCLVLPDGKQYCNKDRSRLRMYMNGVENTHYSDYIFKDLDKILVTYGDDEGVIPQQLASITDFAKNH